MTNDLAPVPTAQGYLVSRTGKVVGPKGVMSTPTTRGGYLTCTIRVNGKKVTTTVQRLVLLAFVGEPPTPEHQANHKNGIKSDNRVENLEWVTRVENIRHAMETGLIKKRDPKPKAEPAGPKPGALRHRITIETAGAVVVIEAREPTRAARSDQMMVTVDGAPCDRLMGVTALLGLIGGHLPRQPSRQAVRVAEIAAAYGGNWR